VIVCLLENGATKGEQNIAAAGRADVVRLGRDILQRASAMEDRLVAAVERLTGRKVRTFLSRLEHARRLRCRGVRTRPDHAGDSAGGRG
jgi:hypothetical protein